MRLIRKQKNRRLYDTQDRRNITLAELAAIIGAGESVRVEDGTGGEDITRAVLLQIVMEQETPGSALLSQSFLEGLIRLYNNPLQQLVTGYLDASMTVFQRQQSELMKRWRELAGSGGASASLAEAAQEGLKGWVGLQRALFDAWTGRDGNDDRED